MSNRKYPGSSDIDSWESKGPSEKQRDFLEDLLDKCEQKRIAVPSLARYKSREQYLDSLDRQTAGEAIEELKTLLGR